MIFRIILGFLILTTTSTTTTLLVTLSNYNINAVSTYTWTLAFANTASRAFMTFTFPSNVQISNSVAKIGGATLIRLSNTSNTLTVDTSTIPISLTTVVIISLVTNPYSALSSTTSFFFESDKQSGVTLTTLSSVTYIPGILSSCVWGFNQCTQQSNSQLTVTIQTINSVPVGLNTFKINFATVWSNLNTKSLVSESTLLTCSISINGGAVNGTGVSCSFVASTILISYSLGTPLNGNDTIIAYVQGVMSPPTQNMPSSSSYTAATADSSGNIIDGTSTGSYCTILPVCVTNLTNGILTPSNPTINTQLTSLITIFPSYPNITFLYLDVVTATYSKSGGLVSCNILKVARGAFVYTLASNFSGGNLNYYFSSSSDLPNVDYGSQIQLLLGCSAIIIPESQAPSTFTYYFKRNAELYLILDATMNSLGTNLNSSNANLFLSSNQMAATNTVYNFWMVTGQPLGMNPFIKLIFASDIGISNVTCSVGIDGTTSASSCSPSGSTLAINFTSTIVIPAGSNITIKISGVTNPLLPQTYFFGVQTYYDNSVNTSRVEYNTAAFLTVYTAITNLAVILSPSTFTVYTITSTNISFVNPVTIPSNSIFLLQFPTQVTQLTSPAQPLLLNGSTVLLSSSPAISSNQITISNSAAISIGNNLTISISIRTPSYINSFSYIKLTVQQNTTIYFQSLNIMIIQVTTPSSMPLSIKPSQSVTGVTTSYDITLTMNIPHDLTFTVVIDVGSDTLFISGGSTCSSNCSAITPLTNSSFSFIVTNPYPNSTTSQNLIFTISSFLNPRSIGLAASWNVTTYTITSSLISLQSAPPTISLPNILKGMLYQNQFYYRNNTSTVKMQLNFSNLLTTTDYILLTMDKSTYNQHTTVYCSSYYGICTMNSTQSTSSVLVIEVIPNVSNIYSNPLELWIEGLISGASTSYIDTSYITVGTYNSAGNLIDQGKISYNISCRDFLTNNCKTCYNNGQCIDCYVSSGYFLNSTICITQCGVSTKYLYYGNNTSGVCESCSGPGGCLTCMSPTSCLTCQNSSYFLYTTTMTCSLFCMNTSGYIQTVIGGINVCMVCTDLNCLQCTNTSYGSCIKCSISSVLINGICSGTCSSVSFFVFNGNCVACNIGCYTCLNASDDRSCTQCAVGYYNSSGQCTSTCPPGQAIISSNRSCGCAPLCLTCDSSNYVNCTSCIDNTKFVYSGSCVPTCPNLTYLSNKTCINCGSGCLGCASPSGICLLCDNYWYIYGGVCYSDCNLISRQYDTFGLTCVMCPDGCDTCSAGVCSSCISGYSISSGACVQSCVLTGSCAVNPSDILPLPGCIAFAVWLGVVLIIRLISHKNYVPYSIITGSSFIQFILIIGVISISKSTISRLLLGLDLSYRDIIRGLLGVSLALNYVFNLIYLFVFNKYIKPLVINPKQIDVISNVAVLILGTISNYRFALIAFAKMFPKPNIYVETSSRLTPIHYLCLVSILGDIFAIVGCGVAVYNQQKLAMNYMLALDLLLIILINLLITLWFISSKKSDQYFEDQKKKYEVQENNATKQNINSNEKDDPKNVVKAESIIDDEDSKDDNLEINLGDSYKKFKTRKTKISTQAKSPNNYLQKSHLPLNSMMNQEIHRFNHINGELKEIPSLSKVSNQYEPHINFQKDIDFEEGLKKPYVRNRQNSITTSYNPSRNQTRNIDEHQLQKNNIFDQANYKDIGNDEVKPNRYIKDIEEADNQSDFPNLSANSKNNSYILQPKQKLIKPKRIATQKGNINSKQEMIKSMNIVSMKKNRNKRYIESDVTNESKQYESQPVVQDLTSIIKKKVIESSIRKSQNINMLKSQQYETEQISPSMYNVQNQRFEAQDIEKINF